MPDKTLLPPGRYGSLSEELSAYLMRNAKQEFHMPSSQWPELESPSTFHECGLSCPAWRRLADAYETRLKTQGSSSPVGPSETPGGRRP